MSKQPFDRIFLIANPKSSGDGLVKARELRKGLRQAFPGLEVELERTKHAGHATEIAARLGKQHPRALFVSVSGDGGYHDMVNGLMQAVRGTKRKPLCAIHGAGYGNDHQRSVRGKTDLIAAIRKGSWWPLDLLKIELITGKKFAVRYAHSYLGFGITGEVAGEIDKTRHTWTPQWLEAARGFVKHEPIPLIVEGKQRSYHSLLLLNVSHFAKFLKGASNTSAADGKFEVIATRARGRWQIVAMGFRALLGRLGRHPQRISLSLELLQSATTQFDGESVELGAGTKLRVTSARHAVRTLGE